MNRLLQRHHWFAIGIGVVVSLMILFLSYRLLYQTSTSTDQYSTINSTPSSTPTPSPTPDPLRPRTALLLGYVGGNHDGSLLTDTILLAQANFYSQEIQLISIPRDLWVPIPITLTNTASESAAPTMGKINQLYALGTDRRRQRELPEQYQVSNGGLYLAQDVIATITGQPIDFVIAINQANLIAALQKLGPVAITVPYSFTDEYFPIAGEETNPCEKSTEEIASLSASLTGFELEKQFPCRYETIAFEAGSQQMDASTAAKFVRSRHAAIGGSDFGRSQRQQALIAGIISYVSSPTNWFTLPTILSAIYSNVETTMEVADLLPLIQLATNPSQWQVHAHQLDKSNALFETRSPDRQYVLVDRSASTSAELYNPDWIWVRSTIDQWLTQTPAVGTASGSFSDNQAP